MSSKDGGIISQNISKGSINVLQNVETLGILSNRVLQNVTKVLRSLESLKNLSEEFFKAQSLCQGACKEENLGEPFEWIILSTIMIMQKQFGEPF